MLLEKDGRPVKYATLLSGGMDSVTLLHSIHPTPQIGISVSYGQRHEKELVFAKEACDSLRVEHVLLEANGLLGSSLIGDGQLIGDDTVLPNRNMIFVSLAANIAASKGCCRIAIGCNSNDHDIYHDCRRGFLESVGKTIAMTTGIRLCWPFLNKTKKEIRQLGLSLGVNFSDTWSCYAGGENPCGECGACIEVEKSK